jgi:hypothetical protein
MKTTTLALAAAILSACASFAIPAAAQTPAPDPVASCRAAHGNNSEARIACLESAIQQMRGQVTAAEQSAAQAQQQAAQAQQQAEQAQQQAAAAQQSRPGWSLPGFRASQQAQQEEQVRVQLVRIRYGRDGFGFFTTAEGQVWRETVASPSRVHLDPERTYEAVIDRGFMGGFRMNVDGVRWEFKVEPLN